MVIFVIHTQKGGPLRDVISSGIQKECHWWSGYDLLRRLLFFIVYLLCENVINDYTQVSYVSIDCIRPVNTCIIKTR